MLLLCLLSPVAVSFKIVPWGHLIPIRETGEVGVDGRAKVDVKWFPWFSRSLSYRIECEPACNLFAGYKECMNDDDEFLMISLFDDCALEVVRYNAVHEGPLRKVLRTNHHIRPVKRHENMSPAWALDAYYIRAFGVHGLSPNTTYTISVSFRTADHAAVIVIVMFGIVCIAGSVSCGIVCIASWIREKRTCPWIVRRNPRDAFWRRENKRGLVRQMDIEILTEEVGEKEGQK